MNISKKIISQSALVGSFGLLGGVFNYLFSASAIKNLDVPQLGQLNTYLSWFQIVLCFPALIQSFIVLRIPSYQKINRFFAYHWILNIFLLALFIVILSFSHLFGETVYYALILSLSICAYCGFNFWLGVCQGQRIFFIFSFLGMLVAFCKFAGTFFMEDMAGYIYIIFISVFIASTCVVFFKGSILNAISSSIHFVDVNKTELRLDLFFSFIVGFFTVVLPNYDILVLRYFVGLESAGEYARIQIFTKIIFFAPMILLQITLPYYVSEKKLSISSNVGVSNPSHRLKIIRRIEILAFVGSFFMCTFFGYLGPLLLEYFFGFKAYSPVLVFLGCLSILPFYLFMSSVQIFAAFKNLKKILFVVLSIWVLPLFLLVFPVENLKEYLIAAISVQFVLALGIFIMTQFEVKK